MRRIAYGFLIMLVTACGQISNEDYLESAPIDNSLSNSLDIVDMRMKQGQIKARVTTYEYVTIVATPNGWKAYNVYGVEVDRDKALILYSNSVRN